MDPGLTLIRILRSPSPSRLRRLDWRRSLDWAPYARARHGFVPLSTADKWFVACNHGTFSFYRSGNGMLVYRVSFVYRERAFKTREALVNDDPLQITPFPERCETRILDYLFDTLLLGRKCSFPALPGVDPAVAPMMERIWMGRAMD